MTSRKRSRQSGVDDAELGLVKLADGDSLAADLVLVRACSSCARGLPVDAIEWDLSGLLIDGTPVQRTTVQACPVWTQPFMEQHSQVQSLCVP
jgi:hypothetical protein